MHHFVEVAVDGDHVSIVAVRASGGTIESCGFRGMGPWDCDAARPRSVAAPTGGAPRTVPAVIGALVVIGGVAAALRFLARRRAGEKGA